MSIPVEIHPAFISKITTALQLVTVLLSLSVLCLPGAFNEIWLLTLYWVTAFFTIISGLHYMARGMKLINNDKMIFALTSQCFIVRDTPF